MGAAVLNASATGSGASGCSIAADDPDAPPRIAAFAQGLQELGWTIGRNVRIDYRWAASDAEQTRKHAAELVALSPDVLASFNWRSRWLSGSDQLGS